MPNYWGGEVRWKKNMLPKVVDVVTRHTLPGQDPALKSLQPAKQNCNVPESTRDLLHATLVYEFQVAVRSSEQDLGAWAGTPWRRWRLLPVLQQEITPFAALKLI